MENIEKKDDHIENICKETQATLHALLWPGLPITSAVFAFYVYEMALDHEDTLGVFFSPAPVTIFVMTLLPVPMAFWRFYRLKEKKERQLQDFAHVDLTSITKNPVITSVSWTNEGANDEIEPSNINV